MQDEENIDEDESNKSDCEFEVASIDRGGGRGEKGRGRSRGRGRDRAKQSRFGSRAGLESSRRRSASRSRGRSSTRGRRKQQSVIHFEQGDTEWIRDLQEDRVIKANNIIDEPSEEGAKNILKVLIITDPHVLVLQRLYQNDIFARHATSVEDINKSQRYAAYTQFTLFKYGKLGAHDRRAVPSYCTWLIRNKLPDPNGHYIENVPIW